MYCVNCGYLMKSEYSYCPYCGTMAIKVPNPIEAQKINENIEEVFLNQPYYRDFIFVLAILSFAIISLSYIIKNVVSSIPQHPDAAFSIILLICVATIMIIFSLYGVIMVYRRDITYCPVKVGLDYAGLTLFFRRFTTKIKWQYIDWVAIRKNDEGSIDASILGAKAVIIIRRVGFIVSPEIGRKIINRMQEETGRNPFIDSKITKLTGFKIFMRGFLRDLQK